MVEPVRNGNRQGLWCVMEETEGGRNQNGTVYNKASKLFYSSSCQILALRHSQRFRNWCLVANLGLWENWDLSINGARILRTWFVQCIMPQSFINAIFTVAMPEQISQQDQLAWAKLCNHKQVMVALRKVTAEQKAVHTIEKQHGNNAHHYVLIHIVHNSRWQRSWQWSGYAFICWFYYF